MIAKLLIYNGYERMKRMNGHPSRGRVGSKNTIVFIRSYIHISSYYPVFPRVCCIPALHSAAHTVLTRQREPKAGRRRPCPPLSGGFPDVSGAIAALSHIPTHHRRIEGSTT